MRRLNTLSQTTKSSLPRQKPRLLQQPARRRGRSNGTIVCDLERRRVIDLLPARSATPVRDWLGAHPSVTVVSRDRSGHYADATRTEARMATQVADRWHLLVNASEALRGIVERQQSEIRDVAHSAVHDPASSPDLAETVPNNAYEQPATRPLRGGPVLRREGLLTREIARRIGASRNPVRRWVRAGRLMPYRRAPGSSQLDRHLPFVEARRQESQNSATMLHRELHAKRFAGGYVIVRR